MENTIKKEIVYNFAQLYYMFFIQRMEFIDEYMSINTNYPLALKLLTQRFNELNFTIKQFDKALYDDTLLLIKETDHLIKEYQGIENDRKLSRHVKPLMLQEKAEIIEEKMNILYRKIMETIDKLDMLLKKETRRDILPIYEE